MFIYYAAVIRTYYVWYIVKSKNQGWLHISKSTYITHDTLLLTDKSCAHRLHLSFSLQLILDVKMQARAYINNLTRLFEFKCTIQTTKIVLTCFMALNALVTYIHNVIHGKIQSHNITWCIHIHDYRHANFPIRKRWFMIYKGTNNIVH